jgi:hypothetical protein
MKAGNWGSQLSQVPDAACIKTTGTPLPPLSVYQRWTPGKSIYDIRLLSQLGALLL